MGLRRPKSLQTSFASHPKARFWDGGSNGFISPRDVPLMSKQSFYMKCVVCGVTYFSPPHKQALCLCSCGTVNATWRTKQQRAHVFKVAIAVLEGKTDVDYDNLVAACFSLHTSDVQATKALFAAFINADEYDTLTYMKSRMSGDCTYYKSRHEELFGLLTSIRLGRRTETHHFRIGVGRTWNVPVRIDVRAILNQRSQVRRAINCWVKRTKHNQRSGPRSPQEGGTFYVRLHPPSPAVAVATASECPRPPPIR